MAQVIALVRSEAAKGCELGHFTQSRRTLKQRSLLRPAVNISSTERPARKTWITNAPSSHNPPRPEPSPARHLAQPEFSPAGLIVIGWW